MYIVLHKNETSVNVMTPALLGWSHDFCHTSAFTNKEVDEVAEWLRRWTANPMCSARVGSNPILVEPFDPFNGRRKCSSVII